MNLCNNKNVHSSRLAYVVLYYGLEPVTFLHLLRDGFFLCAKRRTPEGVLYITTERNRRIRQLTKLNNRVFNQEAVSLLLYNSPKPMLLQSYYIKIIRNSKAYDLTSNDEKRTRPASKYFLTLRTSIVDRPKRTVFSE